MKAMTKKLTILLVVALLLVTMCTLAACGPKDDAVKATAGKFTIQVLLPDGTPAEGIIVQLCVVDPEAEGGLGMCYQGKEADSRGVSVQEWTEDLMEIHLDNLPDGYKMKDSDAKKQIRKGELVVLTLEQK